VVHGAMLPAVVILSQFQITVTRKRPSLQFVKIATPKKRFFAIFRRVKGELNDNEWSSFGEA
jgi:hypothetical protein